MCEKNFWFITNNKPAVSEYGYKKIMSMKDGRVQVFFSKANLQIILAQLERDRAAKARYDSIKENDFLAEETLDINDECFSMPKMRSQLVLQPHQAETLAIVKRSFPTVEVQKHILNARSRVLEKSLVWWAKKIQSHWCEIFGCNPDIFADELLVRMVD